LLSPQEENPTAATRVRMSRLALVNTVSGSFARALESQDTPA
jgi:hypothetical protein